MEGGRATRRLCNLTPRGLFHAPQAIGWRGAVVAVLGLYDKGKTFVLNNLTESKLPSGKKARALVLSLPGRTCVCVERGGGGGGASGAAGAGSGAGVYEGGLDPCQKPRAARTSCAGVNQGALVQTCRGGRWHTLYPARL